MLKLRNSTQRKILIPLELLQEPIALGLQALNLRDHVGLAGAQDTQGLLQRVRRRSLRASPFTAD